MLEYGNSLSPSPFGMNGEFLSAESFEDEDYRMYYNMMSPPPMSPLKLDEDNNLHTSFKETVSLKQAPTVPADSGLQIHSLLIDPNNQHNFSGRVNFVKKVKDSLVNLLQREEEFEIIIVPSGKKHLITIHNGEYKQYANGVLVDQKLPGRIDPVSQSCASRETKAQKLLEDSPSQKRKKGDRKRPAKRTKITCAPLPTTLPLPLLIYLELNQDIPACPQNKLFGVLTFYLPKCDLKGRDRAMGGIWIPRNQSNIDVVWGKMSQTKRISCVTEMDDSVEFPWKFRKFTEAFRYMVCLPDSPFFPRNRVKDSKEIRPRQSSTSAGAPGWMISASNISLDNVETVSVERYAERPLHAFQEISKFQEDAYSYLRVSKKSLSIVSKKKNWR